MDVCTNNDKLTNEFKKDTLTAVILKFENLNIRKDVGLFNRKRPSRLLAIVLIGRGGCGAGVAHRTRHLLWHSRETVRVYCRRDGSQHAGPVGQRCGRRKSTGGTGTTAAARTADTRTRVRFVCRGIIERTADRVGEDAADGVQNRFRRASVPLLVSTAVSKLERVRRFLSFRQQQHCLNVHIKFINNKVTRSFTG